MDSGVSKVKKTITDKVFIEGLKEKVSAWIEQQSKGGPGISAALNITGVTEYTILRLTLKVLTESRRLAVFTRPGKELPKAPPDQTQVEITDPWAVPHETAKEFSAGLDMVDMPSTLRSVQCAKCSGSGQSVCPECEGQKTTYCLHCRGDGKLACEKCKKTLKVNCPSCQGRGKIYSETTQNYEDCSQCEGKGSFPCKECDKGYNTCPSCEGKGRKSCEKCKEKGFLECITCGGQGNIISGSRLEISKNLVEERLELPENGIPENMLSDDLAVVRFVSDKIIELEQGTGAADLTDELAEGLAALEAKLHIPAGSHVLRKTLLIEKRLIYNMDYRSGDQQNTAWFGFLADKFVVEKGILKKIYAGVIDDLGFKLSGGDLEGALRLAGQVERIAFLKPEAEMARKAVSKQYLKSYLYGAAVGLAISAALAVPAAHHLWKASYFFGNLLAAVCAFSVVSAAASAAVLSALRLALFNTKVKRVAAAAVLAALPVSVALGLSVSLKYNPAAKLDAGRMQGEYQRHFPYGLRTLANDEDINFLKTLIEKYSKTGVDLSQTQKDLKWLIEKKESDRGNMEKIEKAAREIERVSQKKKSQKRKTYKSLPQMYIK